MLGEYKNHRKKKQKKDLWDKQMNKKEKKKIFKNI